MSEKARGKEPRLGKRRQKPKHTKTFHEQNHDFTKSEQTCFLRQSPRKPLPPSTHYFLPAFLWLGRELRGDVATESGVQILSFPFAKGLY